MRPPKWTRIDIRGAPKLVHQERASHRPSSSGLRSQVGGATNLNILRVRCQSAEEFRNLYQADQPNGGLFCPTTKQLTEGTPVVIELVCKFLPNRVLIRGSVVSWRPALPRLR